MDGIFSIHVTNERLRNTLRHTDVIISKNIYPSKYLELGSQTVIRKWLKCLPIKEKNM
jgi:hypothetical protein